MSGWAWLFVACGGAVGAASRYLADAAVSRRRSTRLPVATMLINISGSALLAALAATVDSHGVVFAGVGIGFCGGFTTFSTFTWETFALAEDGLSVAALGNVAVSLLAGLGAASLTYWLL